MVRGRMRFAICVTIFILAGCTAFQSRVSNKTRTLKSNSFNPVWDWTLYELPIKSGQDTLASYEQFTDSGHYYAFRDRMIDGMIYLYLDSLRIAAIPNTEASYRNERPRLSDSLYAKYPGGSYHPFQGSLSLTEDTIWKWLGDDATLETSDRTRTLAQLLKPKHWYLFVFDSEGPTHSIGRGHYFERRVSFSVDSAGQISNWTNTRKRMRKMRLV